MVAIKIFLKKIGATPSEQHIELVGEPVCLICNTDIRFLAVCPNVAMSLKLDEKQTLDRKRDY